MRPALSGRTWAVDVNGLFDTGGMVLVWGFVSICGWSGESDSYDAALVVPGQGQEDVDVFAGGVFGASDCAQRRTVGVVVGFFGDGEDGAVFSVGADGGVGPALEGFPCCVVVGVGVEEVDGAGS